VHALANITVTMSEEPLPSSVGKSTVTRRCFSWLRDVNLRVCLLIISITSRYTESTFVPVVHCRYLTLFISWFLLLKFTSSSLET